MTVSPASIPNNEEKDEFFQLNRLSGDLFNAKCLVIDYGKDIRYCVDLASWFIWDPSLGIWKEDTDGRMQNLAEKAVENAEKKAQNLPTSQRKEVEKNAHSTLGSIAKVRNMIQAAKADRRVIANLSQFDANPYLFTVANGTIDLRTKKLHPHRREDLITKRCPTEYHPTSYGKHWSSFLESIFLRDYEMIRYIKMLFGYGITGLVKEQVLPIFYGNGSNGKSTLINAIKYALGDSYVTNAAPDLVLDKPFGSHPTELADLFGTRIVFSSEPDISNKLNESRVKILTGGDCIKARKMHENFWEFKPTHKIFLVTNNLPAITGTDYGIWRRIRIVPFDRIILRKDADFNMDDKLRGEACAILDWVVNGAYEYLNAGRIEVPKKVIDESEKYQLSQDPLDRFITEACAIDHQTSLKASELYAAFFQWNKDNFRHEISATKFGSLLESSGRRYGIKKKRISSGIVYFGLRILSEEERFDRLCDIDEIEPEDTDEQDPEDDIPL